MQSQRVRIPSDLPGAPCQLCGGATAVVRSQAVRRGVHRLNPRFDADVRVYEQCERCSAKRRVGGDASPA